MSLALGVALVLSLAAADVPPPIDPAAQAVVERSRTTTTTYSVYQWNWLRLSDGEPYQIWSAEFHDGTRHRVENPVSRLVADCAAQTGTLVSLIGDATQTGPEIARMACGIDANQAVTSLELARRDDGPFGPVETVRLIAGGKERFYVVDGDGVLLAAEIFSLVSGDSECLQNAPVAVERAIPEGDIFSAESLAYSVVAPRYQTPPAGNFGDFWIGDRRCIEEP